MAQQQTNNRAIWSWALYDWANSAFATVVLAGFFPLLFQDFWNQGVPVEEANLRLGWTNAAASLVIALMAPFLGALADQAGAKKRLLLIFAGAGMVATAGLAGIGQGDWAWASGLFVLAAMGFLGANLFYDALLMSVAPKEKWHVVSGLGFGLGYLGGGLLYLGCVLAALNPHWLGLSDGTEAVLHSFWVTALWWALFTIPLALWVREPKAQKVPGTSLWRGSLGQVVSTLRQLRHYRSAGLFLLAYWLYIDGIDTVVRMAVAYGRALGFERSTLILALLLVQFVGFPAAIAFGYLGERMGPRRGIYLGLVVYVLVCIWAAFITAPWEFFVMAVLIGLVQGGVQALSRSCFARLIPAEMSGEFFGFYNLMGKFAVLIGPPLFGLFGTWFGDVRYSMLALVLLFVAGGLLLSRVPARELAGK